MKTSELKRILSEYCENFNETENVIYDVDWRLWKKDQRLLVRGVIPLNILKVLGEYHNTPLNEREDEKKYLVKTSIPTMSDFVIYLNSEENEFILFPISQKFTQQEIDNFPKEIKGAIECGFLRKVEVE